MTAIAGRKVGLPIPENGIQLPVGEPGDLTSWAESVARSRLAPDTPPEQVDAFAQYLLSATADSQERGALMAIAFTPIPESGEIARIELRDYTPDALRPTLPSLAEIVGWLASPTAGAIAEPEVTYGETPLGPAARLKMRLLSEENDEGELTILNNSVYVIRPREYECVIMLNVTWAAGAFTLQLDELADQLAQQLEIV